ncbi:Uncharacterised protein [Mycobacteroides abscessus]|nr:Uncharacterised protein [Mycobacteroides abscessus]
MSSVTEIVAIGMTACASSLRPTSTASARRRTASTATGAGTGR